MKKLGLLVFILCSLQANGQPFSISFSGIGLSTVKVQNLTTGVIVDVPAGDVLYLSTITDIQENIDLKSSGLKIYPNPMTDKSTLTILPPISGDAIITICDLTGKILIKFKDFLNNCAQEFSLSGLKNGLYVINVQGSSYHFSSELLSTGISDGTENITKLNDNIRTASIKKAMNEAKGLEGTINMAYNSGERLKYTAVSGNNSTVMTDIPTTDKTVIFTFSECKDGDNNYYPIVQIENQIWMAENLKTTKYIDGTDIPQVTDNTAWSNLLTSGYCWYNNNIANKDIYGGLYNWYTVKTGNLCPSGWHFPNIGYNEFNILYNYLNMNGYRTIAIGDIAKSVASTSGWASSTIPGAVGNTDYPALRNATGFSALPSGYRGSSGTFQGLGGWAYYWSDEYAYPEATTYVLIYLSGNFSGFNNNNRKSGMSVRCVRDR